jgi:hypothetical protein
MATKQSTVLQFCCKIKSNTFFVSEEKTVVDGKEVRGFYFSKENDGEIVGLIEFVDKKQWQYSENLIKNKMLLKNMMKQVKDFIEKEDKNK